MRSVRARVCCISEDTAGIRGWPNRGTEGQIDCAAATAGVDDAAAEDDGVPLDGNTCTGPMSQGLGRCCLLDFTLILPTGRTVPPDDADGDTDEMLLLVLAIGDGYTTAVRGAAVGEGAGVALEPAIGDA